MRDFNCWSFPSSVHHVSMQTVNDSINITYCRPTPDCLAQAIRILLQHKTDITYDICNAHFSTGYLRADYGGSITNSAIKHVVFDGPSINSTYSSTCFCYWGRHRVTCGVWPITSRRNTRLCIVTRIGPTTGKEVQYHEYNKFGEL